MVRDYSRVPGSERVSNSPLDSISDFPLAMHCPSEETTSDFGSSAQNAIPAYWPGLNDLPNPGSPVLHNMSPLPSSQRGPRELNAHISSCNPDPPVGMFMSAEFAKLNQVSYIPPHNYPLMNHSPASPRLHLSSQHAMYPQYSTAPGITLNPFSAAVDDIAKLSQQVSHIPPQNHILQSPLPAVSSPSEMSEPPERRSPTLQNRTRAPGQRVYVDSRLIECSFRGGDDQSRVRRQVLNDIQQQSWFHLNQDEPKIDVHLHRDILKHGLGMVGRSIYTVFLAEDKDSNQWRCLFGTEEIQCKNMGTRFERVERAIEHVRSHLGHRPFACDGACHQASSTMTSCEKRFYGKAYLLDHKGLAKRATLPRGILLEPPPMFLEHGVSRSLETEENATTTLSGTASSNGHFIASAEFSPGTPPDRLSAELIKVEGHQSRLLRSSAFSLREPGGVPLAGSATGSAKEVIGGQRVLGRHGSDCYNALDMSPEDRDAATEGQRPAKKRRRKAETPGNHRYCLEFVFPFPMMDTPGTPGGQQQHQYREPVGSMRSVTFYPAPSKKSANLDIPSVSHPASIPLLYGNAAPQSVSVKSPVSSYIFSQPEEPKETCTICYITIRTQNMARHRNSRHPNHIESISQLEGDEVASDAILIRRNPPPRLP